MTTHDVLSSRSSVLPGAATPSRGSRLFGSSGATSGPPASSAPVGDAGDVVTCLAQETSC